MNGSRIVWYATILLLGAACAPSPPPPPPLPPPPPAPEPAPVFEFPFTEVWTAGPGVVLRADSAAHLLPRPFTRLRVVAADSLGLDVRCAVCPDSATGRVAFDQVVYRAASPAEAAHGTLAGFALAVRGAAARDDVAALRPVMAPGFTASFIGEQNPDAASAIWSSEGFRSLRELPALLDRGLSTRDSSLWVAPPDHIDRLDYQGLRSGFRRTPDGRWEWVFLIRGEAY